MNEVELAGLDASYVRDAGRGVAHYMLRNRPCELAYTPGNGTLYELLFVPMMGCDGAHSWMDHDRRRSIVADRPELREREESMILLGWLGHGCWQVDLTMVWHESYLVDKYADCSQGDAAALRALLLEVATASHMRTLAVVR